MSARDVLAMALVRHIEGDSVTRDLITDDEWAGYLSDADYVSGLIAAAGVGGYVRGMRLVFRLE